MTRAPWRRPGWTPWSPRGARPEVTAPRGSSTAPGTGPASALVLVPQIPDAVAMPVLASGGLADGRGLAAALALGATGVLLGTRFVATREYEGDGVPEEGAPRAGRRLHRRHRRFTGLYARAIGSTFNADYAGSGAPVFPALVRATRRARDITPHREAGRPRVLPDVVRPGRGTHPRPARRRRGRPQPRPGGAGGATSAEKRRRRRLTAPGGSALVTARDILDGSPSAQSSTSSAGSARASRSWGMLEGGPLPGPLRTYLRGAAGECLVELEPDLGEVGPALDRKSGVGPRAEPALEDPHVLEAELPELLRDPRAGRPRPGQVQ